MLKYISLLLTSIMTLMVSVGCIRTEQTASVMLDRTERSEYVLEDELFVKQDSIVLRFPDDASFVGICKMMMYESKIYIMDKSSKTIYVFRPDGTYSHKVGVFGRGHGEYVNISDFTIDRERSRIVILSYPSRVLQYDLDGKFIEDKKVDETLLWSICSMPWGFVLTTNHCTYTEGEHAKLIYRFDKNFDLLEKTGDVLPKQVAVPSQLSQTIEYVDGKAVYYDAFGMSVHVIADDCECAQYRMCDDGQIKINTEVFSSNVSFIERQAETSFIMNSFMTGDDIHLFVCEKGKLKYVAVDLSDSKMVISPFLGIYPRIVLYSEPFVYYAFPEQAADNSLTLYKMNYLCQMKPLAFP